MVARPRDGAPLILEATASLVWSSLERWQTLDDLLQVLRVHHPEVPAGERSAALDQIVTSLAEEGLLERRAR